MKFMVQWNNLIYQGLLQLNRTIEIFKVSFICVNICVFYSARKWEIESKGTQPETINASQFVHKVSSHNFNSLPFCDNRKISNSLLSLQWWHIKFRLGKGRQLIYTEWVLWVWRVTSVFFSFINIFSPYTDDEWMKKCFLFFCLHLVYYLNWEIQRKHAYKM